MSNILIALIIFVKLCQFATSSPPEFWSEFESAKESYYDGDWAACYHRGENAVAGFSKYKHLVLACVEKCTETKTQNLSENSLADSFFQSVKISSCLDDCAEDRVSAEIWRVFITREPYDYLQMCYYKADMLTSAVKAAVTFTVANPTHAYMLQNLKTYREVLNISEEYLIDVEAPKHQVDYKLARQSCDSYQSNCSSLMRHTLDSYMKSYNECILLCDINSGSKSHEGQQLQFMYTIIADLLKPVFQCKSKCLFSLNCLDLNEKPYMLYDILYTLYQANLGGGDLVASLRYLDTVILLSQSDVQAIKKGLESQALNDLRTALLSKHGLKFAQGQPMEEVVTFISKVTEINDIIKYLKEGGHNSRKNRLDKEFSAHGIQVIRTGSELSGEERFVADNVISIHECNTLMNLCKEHGVDGDGYGSETPHTVHEKFRGLSIPNTLKLVEEGHVSRDQLDLYLNVSENLKRYLEYYFNTAPLYFHYTHLVCRTAIDDNIHRTDLSHPVHADNCVFIAGDQCYKRPPAFTQRDYSGLLYLNEEFRGGEFFFADEHEHEQAIVKPTCGRFVGFDGGSLHGVKALTQGQRCAVAVWLTLDESSAEVSRKEAADYLTSLRVTSCHIDVRLWTCVEVLPWSTGLRIAHAT